jgi:hypothetical protein
LRPQPPGRTRCGPTARRSRRITPANTTYVVAGFIPDVLVEVELDAIIQDAG